ncbi:MAG: hemerythrin domain-containing protein [Thiogranum sp.]
MGSTNNWLAHEHSMYESLLSRCVEAVEIEDWKTVDKLFRRMITHLKRHMALEEEVLYPAYEAEAHAPQGPTGALREEHDHIVRLVTDMVRVITTRDSDYVTECLVQLEKQMIKHHEKEEDIFLPMASHILEEKREVISRQLAEFDVSNSGRKWDI